MKKTRLRPISDKQREKLRLWGQIVRERIKLLIAVYKYPICEYCGRPEKAHEFWALGGHHIDKNRNNNIPENCYVCHNVCHRFITDENIAVKQQDFQGRDDPRIIEL